MCRIKAQHLKWSFGLWPSQRLSLCSIRNRKIQIDVPLRRKLILILFFTVIILFYLLINIFDVPDKGPAFEEVIWSLALPKALPV
jgi:hypothetical protein